MVEALVIAGGKGIRTNQDIPKQFINIDNIPVLIYTLNAFQQHPEVDEILTVCIDGWHEILWAYARQFNISKLKCVVSGGNTGQESIRNGIMELKKHHSGEDIVLIHDGIRPNPRKSYQAALRNADFPALQLQLFHVQRQCSCGRNTENGQKN